MKKYSLILKRVFDLIMSICVLGFSLPAAGLISLLIKKSGPGPILIKQSRMGKGLQPFMMYKFRTMKQSKDGSESLKWTAEEEARITNIGHILRDYGLDELPQLINILQGEMSIIGPRPPLPTQVDFFTERQKKMFNMRPGVLSLAAIKGRRSVSMEERYEQHVQYVENWNLALDLKIFCKAAWIVLTGKDARER